MLKRLSMLVIFLTLIVYTYADLYKIPAIKYPDLKKENNVGEISVSKVKLDVPDWGPMTLRISRPNKYEGLLPVVFVPPAGTNLISGSEIDETYDDEELPYAKAGFLVVHFSLPGQIDEKMSEQKIGENIVKFVNSKLGVLPALIAIDYTLKKIQNINPKMLISAGHSSAGTLSLQMAMASDNIAYCIAYAPCSSYEKWFDQDATNELFKTLPLLKTYFSELDPFNNTERLKVPAFIFGAQDDSVVPFKDTYEYVKKLKKSNSKVMFKMVKTGDHYDSMIQQGIPQAIKWLQIQQRKAAAQNVPETELTK